MILIEQQGVPEDYVQTTVNAYAEQLLQTIYQRVTAAADVVELIDRLDLYPDDRGTVPEEELILRFRDSTEMSPQNVTSVHMRTGREAIVTFGFVISFQHEVPRKARDVAQDLADRFVAENVTLRSEAAARTTAFLDTETAGIEQELARNAERIADFKEKNENNLPENQEVNLRTWERLRDELNEVENRRREVREEIALLETDIANTPRYRPVLDDTGDPVLGGIDRLGEAQQELIRLRGRYSESHPEIIALRREIAALSASPVNDASLAENLRTELEAKRNELAATRQVYSENHPDVINLRRTVASLESQLADLESRSGSYPSAGLAAPNNPLYLQLRTQSRSAEGELADLNRQRKDLVSRIDVLDRRRVLAPQVERAYAALTQEREVLLERFHEVRNLEAEAAMGQALEAGQSGQRLRIVEPARVPAIPVSPNRVSLSLLGVVLAIALGLGVASIAEAMDTKVRGRRDIYQLLQAPPIAIIPYVETRGDTIRRVSLNAAMVAIFLTALAVVIATVVS
jgi:uncharacterized protein involved in exopolysaccharide biosynthesis